MHQFTRYHSRLFILYIYNIYIKHNILNRNSLFTPYIYICNIYDMNHCMYTLINHSIVFICKHHIHVYKACIYTCTMYKQHINHCVFTPLTVTESFYTKYIHLTYGINHSMYTPINHNRSFLCHIYITIACTRQ